jgi:hypothetical protein
MFQFLCWSHLFACKSNYFTSPQHSALHKANWMKKSQNMPVWLSKVVSAQHFPQNAEVSKRQNKA